MRPQALYTAHAHHTHQHPSHSNPGTRRGSTASSSARNGRCLPACQCGAGIGGLPASRPDWRAGAGVLRRHCLLLLLLARLWPLDARSLIAAPAPPHHGIDFGLISQFCAIPHPPPPHLLLPSAVPLTARQPLPPPAKLGQEPICSSPASNLTSIPCPYCSQILPDVSTANLNPKT
jgi:hypothetical protein